MRAIEMTGKRFGRLVVLEKSAKKKPGKIYWICKCDCGNTTHPIDGASLRNGKTKSCGCFGREQVRKAHTTHGGRYSKINYIWHNMKERCNNPSYRDYENYGGRGIAVCDEWNNSFECFRDWALNNGYNPNAKRGMCTLDRINVNGNYEPSNCRWTTQKEQCNNIRKNIVITIDGISRTITQWADESGLGEATIRYRYHHGYKGRDLISHEKHKFVDKSNNKNKVV